MRINGPQVTVYITEHLTQFNEKIFREAKETIRSEDVKFIWTRNRTTLVQRLMRKALLFCGCLQKRLLFGVISWLTENRIGLPKRKSRFKKAAFTF